MFVRIELEINDHDHDECQDKETHLIAHKFCQGEHVSAFVCSQTVKASSRETIAIHICVNLSLE